MQRLHDLVVVLERKRLRGTERFLELGRQFVLAHLSFHSISVGMPKSLQPPLCRPADCFHRIGKKLFFLALNLQSIFLQGIQRTSIPLVAHNDYMGTMRGKFKSAEKKESRKRRPPTKTGRTVQPVIGKCSDFSQHAAGLLRSRARRTCRAP